MSIRKIVPMIGAILGGVFTGRPKTDFTSKAGDEKLYFRRARRPHLKTGVKIRARRGRAGKAR